MKKMVIMSMAAIIFATQVGIALAMLDGNPRKGRFLFRQECRPCHMENPIGAVPAHYLGPDAKRQAEWLEVFENKENLPCYEHWKDMPEADLTDILTYLHGGAADSPTPERCG
ncbi:cytochrome c [Desulfonatronovibrio hydrogenovorans]|uniref:cytochrome c n=1 Tax=Desulfonatronovibrio hydrogenovorans TaxID=53245 RepID=UPI00048CA030|nr:cytochrome c [Desulfonatronovibrio hydrogenovorans]